MRWKTSFDSKRLAFRTFYSCIIIYRKRLIHEYLFRPSLVILKKMKPYFERKERLARIKIRNVFICQKTGHTVSIQLGFSNVCINGAVKLPEYDYGIMLFHVFKSNWKTNPSKACLPPIKYQFCQIER